jgi:HAD superfamily hydrolase (TIGR01509 family)
VTEESVECFAAVLWDLDGTITDTETYWIRAYRSVAGQYGAHLGGEHVSLLAGMDLIGAAHFVRAFASIQLSAPRLAEAFTREVAGMLRKSIPWRPGARELLSQIRGAGWPSALVTGSPAVCAAPALAALPRGTFEAVVTADSGVAAKPDAAPYREAMRLLGMGPAQCLAIEDSETGARSAQAAGCKVVVIPQLAPVAPAPGRFIRASLTGLGIEELMTLVDGEPDS